MIQSPTYKRVVVDELHTFLDQEFEVTESMVVERVLPHLFIRGVPAGSITLEVRFSSAVVGECTQTVASILTQTGKTKLNYHGYVSFSFDKSCILKPGTYTLRLTASGYTFGESAYVGWVKTASSPTQLNRVRWPHDFSMTEIRRP